MAKTKGANAKQRDKSREIGVPGLRVSAGVIEEEFLPDLVWPKQNAVFKEMIYNDATIAAVLFAIETTIKKVPILVKDNGDTEGKIFIEQCLDDMDKTVSEVIEDILSMLGYGYAVNEIVYKQRIGPTNSNKFRRSKYSDGLWGWKKLPIRAQDTIDRWVFEGDKVDKQTSASIGVLTSADTSELAGVIQRPPLSGSGKFIPRKKFLLFRNNSKKDNPESISVLRTAYRSWYFKKTLEDFEAIGVERALVNIPVFRIPAEYMAEDADSNQQAVYQAFKDMGVNLRNNTQSSVIIPSDRDDTGNSLFELSFEGGPNRPGAQDVNKIIERYDAAILSTVLADFIRMGQKSAGSGALGGHKLKLFKSAIESWLDSIVNVFNREAIPRLWEMNGWPADATMPTLVHGSITESSLEELADYLDKLAERSLIEPDDDLEKHLREKADLPEKQTRRETTEERIQNNRDQSLKEVAEIQQQNPNQPGNEDDE